MRYYSVVDMAKKWNISERSVRNYCAQGRVKGAILNGKTWSIPENARKPERINKSKKQLITLLDILKQEKDSRASTVQADLIVLVLQLIVLFFILCKTLAFKPVS